MENPPKSTPPIQSINQSTPNHFGTFIINYPQLSWVCRSPRCRWEWGWTAAWGTYRWDPGRRCWTCSPAQSLAAGCRSRSGSGCTCSTRSRCERGWSSEASEVWKQSYSILAKISTDATRDSKTVNNEGDQIIKQLDELILYFFSCVSADACA